MANKDTPKFSRPLESRHCFIVPAKMLATLTTKSHSPAVARKPGVGLGCSSMSNRTRAVRKGVKVAFNASWVDEEMSIRSIYAQKSVRMSYQASTTSTLVGFGPIATDSFDGRKKAKHSWFQSQEG
ncbi:MAG: hypothetical protein PVH08_16550 [Syntrophobacterales bacterium]